MPRRRQGWLTKVGLGVIALTSLGTLLLSGLSGSKAVQQQEQDVNYLLSTRILQAEDTVPAASLMSMADFLPEAERRVNTSLGMPYDIGDTRVFGDKQSPVAVTFANEAYMKQGLVPNLVCSWRRLKWEAWVVVATDEAAYEMGRARGYEGHLHWHAPYWKGSERGQLREDYNTTTAYLHFIHRRTKFMEGLLHLLPSQNFILTDGDTVWMHNPITAVQRVYPDSSRCDAFVVNDAHRGGDGPSRVEPVGGFLVLRNSPRLRALYRIWTATQSCLQSREQPAMHCALVLTKARVGRWSTYRADSLGVPPHAVMMCVLHDMYFPTSTHLNMRPGDSGPVSQYMTDYNLTSAYLPPGVVVAHANLKYKSNKVLWFKQFGWWLQERFNQCRPIVMRPLPPIPPVRATNTIESNRFIDNIGWAEVKGRGWISDIPTFLRAHHTPDEPWGACSRVLSRRVHEMSTM